MDTFADSSNIECSNLPVKVELEKLQHENAELQEKIHSFQKRDSTIEKPTGFQQYIDRYRNMVFN